MTLSRRFRILWKFQLIERYFGTKPFRLLDIGAGNHSASKTHDWFPACEYHGVDLDKNYNNDERDFQLMTAFYELNLETLDYAGIPDNYFDVVMMSHVIEHLRNGDEVITHLLPKLQPGGVICIEFPGLQSTTLPSMKGTLNFFDDDTHVRLYSRAELYNLFMREGCQVLAGGYVRRWPAILLMPFKVVQNLLQHGRIIPSVLWDFLGFAEYVVARKPAA